MIVLCIYTRIQTHTNHLFNYGKPDNANALIRCLALCALATLSCVTCSAIISCVTCIGPSVVITGLVGVGAVAFGFA